MPISSPRTRAVAEVVSGAVALLAFVATSPPPEESPPDPESFGTSGGFEAPAAEESAALVLHNGLAVDVVVRLRRLAAAVDVDCEAVGTDPGALLSEALLGETESWTIPAGDNLGLEATPGRACEVLRVEGDGFSPRWVMWNATAGRVQAYRPDEEPFGDGVLRLSLEGTGAVLEGGAELVFAPENLARGVEQCAPTTDGQRMEWGDPLPSGGIVLSAEWGPDGCGSIVFAEGPDVAGAPWFLCMPEQAWRFEVGEEVSVAPVFGGGGESVEMTSLDEAGGIRSRVLAFRAGDVPSLEDLSMAYEPNDLCGYDVETRCGTVSRTGRLVLSTVDGTSAPLEAGGVLDGLTTGGLRTRVEVLTAQERAALDPECALGPDVLGPDLAVVVTQIRAEVE